MPVLTIENVGKLYAASGKGVPALEDVNWTVERGSFVAIMGPSGCGKSTLLHLIGAMDRPTSGRVEVDGVDLGSSSESELVSIRREKIGFVFQFYNLLPTLTALENVSLPGLLAGRDRKQSNENAMRVLGQVGLVARANHYPAQLSGGEMQRVAIARSVVHDPCLLLADEPTGSLDSQNGQRVMELITEINQELGVTVILATHDDEVASYATRCVHMRDGHLLEDPQQRLRNSP